MHNQPILPRRRSIRLHNYDYSTIGAYFVTICAFGRECLFGEVVEGEMMLNGIGAIVTDTWEGLPDRYPGIVMDMHVIMPNHFHGIICLVGAPLAGARGNNDVDPVGAPLAGARNNRAGTRPAPTLGDMVGAFKSLTTVALINAVKRDPHLPFMGRLWQRNYHERIIRDDRELVAIREYIAANPARWTDDENHPARASNRILAAAREELTIPT
jgi:REP element-mobilizing transposase RayT